MSRSAPSISVVIMCFNYARYVGACVASVLEQTRPALEVIVVNDGSTDDSSAVLAGLGRRIRVIEQPNRGLVPARNRGFAVSRGEVVLFLDADDALHPQALDEVARAWTPDCAKVQYELEVIDAEGATTGRRICNYVEPYGSREVREEFRRFGTYVWPPSGGNAYSRWFLEPLFPLGVAWGPDGLLNTLAPLYGEVAVVRRVLGYYRVHGANNSYHGVTNGPLGRRFAKRIEIRVNELRLLAEHAAARGHVLPTGNVLDHELPFVNYRMILKRLGEDYEGALADSAVRLWWAGALLLVKRPLPIRRRLAHGVWLTALLISPRWLCRRLVPLRFNAALLNRVGRALACVLPRRPSRQPG